MQQSGMSDKWDGLRDGDALPAERNETRPLDADERTPAVMGEQLACRRAELGLGML